MKLKRGLLVLMAGAMLFITGCFSSSGGDEGDEIIGATEYEYVEVTGGYEIKSYLGKQTEIVIPGEYKGKPIISIGNFAFYDSEITKITIPDTVIEIKKTAFGYNKLTEIKIPDSVKIIGEKAFMRNDLRELTIPDSVIEVGQDAFASNENLSKLKLGNGLEEVDGWVFQNSGIEQIEWGANIKIIGSSTFYGHKIKNIVIPEGVLGIASLSFKPGTDHKIETVKIPGSFTYNIDKTAFSDIDKLQKNKTLFYVKEGSKGYDFVVEHKLLYELY